MVRPSIYSHTSQYIDIISVNLILCISAGESSSYGGDSEDSDWAPPPVAPERGAEVEEDDDIDELLSEAKDFIANEKMRKC